jgi:FkbM family methyltransferase
MADGAPSAERADEYPIKIEVDGVGVLARIFGLPRQKARQPAGLAPDDIAAGFTLLLGRAPLDHEQQELMARLTSLAELTDYLLRSDEFRARYTAMVAPNSPAAFERPPPIFLGDRVLCWTHHGQRIYLVPQDMDLTPRILFSGDWENHVEQTMLRLLRPGATVVDLGSNVGYHTLNFATAVGESGRVFAFEADPRLARLLRATLFINHFENIVELQCCAVTDGFGTLTLAAGEDHYGSGNIVPAGSGAGYDAAYPNRIEVPTVTLDAALGQRIEAIDLLHLDIEGAEPRALRGAQTLIERSPRLKIVTEWSRNMMQLQGTDIALHVDWLSGLGFRFWRIENDTANLIPLDRAGLAGLPHCDLLLSRSDPACAADPAA